MLAIRYLTRCLSLLLVLSCCSSASAHFPWLIRSADGNALFFFGEGLQDRTYKLPASISQAEIYSISSDPDSKPSLIPMSPVETEDFVGLRGSEKIPAQATLVSQVTFGIYHGSKLEYTVFSYGYPLPRERDSRASAADTSPFVIELVETAVGVDAFLSWNGKSIPGTEVHLYGNDGEKTTTKKTDENGKVSFEQDLISEGTNAVMAGHQVKEAGKWQEAEYDSQSYYLTATFGGADGLTTEQLSQQLPPLPVEVTSFGACRDANSIYIYGGHMGAAHSYSREGQNRKLLKLELNHPEKGWQEIATGKPLQGLGMVAHRDRVILIGGFTAMNEEGEDHDLHSQSTVTAFDTNTNQWTDLAPLPEPRSSHDAALVGDILYVVGGWQMSGPDQTSWHTTAWSMDLSAESPQWTALPQPPFVRRALATIAHEDKLFVVGGMNEQGGPTRAVVVYDPKQQSWTEAPEIKGESGMAGFGTSGWSLNGRLIVNTYEGSIQAWNSDSRDWEVVGASDDARFFHRILPLNQGNLVSLGGANMEVGKFSHLEVISVN